MSIYSQEELLNLGFKSIGENVRISRKTSFYNRANINIGSNVRIDDFCVLSAGRGGITIGSYIHIGVYSCLIGAGEIILHDFSNISSKVSIYSSNDDYSGEFMTNPMVPKHLTNVVDGPVKIGKHVIVGSGCVILPNSQLGMGAAIGALSLVEGDIPDFTIWGGIPARKIGYRKKNLLELEKVIVSGSTRDTEDFS